MSGPQSLSVAIIGGGATGVILAAHLMRRGEGRLRISLVDRSSEIGKGLAYSTQLPDHRLNVRADAMGVFADRKEEFWSWARSHGHAGQDSQEFLPRELYGGYLSAVFKELSLGSGGAIHVVRDECIDIVPTASGVEIRLASGVSLPTHVAMLALGHDPNPAPEQAYGVRLDSPQDTPIAPEARIAILGSGLSMIDAWLTLEHRGHRGEIDVISRRGLLPLAHREDRIPLRLDAADIPLGTELSYFVRWFGDLVQETEEAGGDWRDVVDGLRPFSQRIWRDWPASARRRFLEHTKAWWDIHRHRLAPDIRARAEDAIAKGRLKLIAAKVVDVIGKDNGDVSLIVRHRKNERLETIDARRVYDCTGLTKDITQNSNTLVQRLFATGVARPDPLKLGIDVTAECAVIDDRGNASEKLFALGPITRGTFFEVDAVPEIRRQCMTVAERIAGRTAAARFG